MHTTAEEPVEAVGGPGGIAELDRAIAAAKAELHLLRAEKSRVQAAALPASHTYDVPLHAWQRRALEDWNRAGRRGVVQAVTGAGKTRVGVAAIAEALSQGRRAVVVAPSLVLVKQWVDTLVELLPDVVVSDTLGDSRPWRVLVTTFQSAMRRAAIPFGEQALLVADECHRAGAEGFSLALRQCFHWRLGLTATLQRDDDGDDILQDYFGGIVHDLGYREALSDGLIAPFRFAHVSVPLLPTERATYDELTDGLRVARDRLIIQHSVPEEPIGAFLKTVSQLAQDRSPSSGGGLARHYMKLFSTRRSLLAETPVKMLALANLGTAVKESNGTIVFTQTRESSSRAAEVLRGEGCTSASIHGDLEKEAREEHIDLFRTGSVISLTAPRVLDEGVDVPEADLGIVTAANRSRRQMIQRLGRVLRRRPGKTARFVVMYAAGTVEDPYFRGHVPDFHDVCLPFADDVQRFDLSDAGDLDRLLGFLGASEQEGCESAGRSVPQHPQPSRAGFHGRARPADARPCGLPSTGPVPPPAEDRFTVVKTDEAVELLAAWCTLSDDPVRDYLRLIARHQLLTAEEEVELSRAIEAGLYARHLLDSSDHRFDPHALQRVEAVGHESWERMVCANLRLVVSIAKRHTGFGLELLDLVQEGNLGLMRAADKFDHAVGTKFSTYATWWVKQAITRGLADLGSTIRVPVHFHEVRLKVDRFRRQTNLSWSELLRQYPDGIDELDVDADAVRRAAKLSRPIISIEALTEEVEDSVVFAPLDGTDGPANPEGVVESLATRQTYTAIMNRLEHEDPRNAFILRARFGAVTGDEETLETVGRRLGITRERVRQLEKQAINRAREIACLLEQAPPRPVASAARPKRIRRETPQRAKTKSTAAVARRADVTRAPRLDEVQPRRAAAPHPDSRR